MVAPILHPCLLVQHLLNLECSPRNHFGSQVVHLEKDVDFHHLEQDLLHSLECSYCSKNLEQKLELSMSAQVLQQ